MTPATESHARVAPNQGVVLRRLFRAVLFRRRRGGQSAKGPRARDSAILLGRSILAYAFIGVLASEIRGDLFSYVACIQGLTFGFTAMNMAVSSGSFLFNPLEPDILLHRPIHPRSLLAAKAQVLYELAFVLALALNLVAFWRGTVLAGTWRFIPAHLFSIALGVMFVSVSVISLYNLCLRWFGRERVEAVVTTVQICFVISLVIGSQIVIQMPRFAPSGLAAAPRWVRLLPPVWFAKLELVLLGVDQRPGSIALAALAVIGTLLLTWLAIGALAQSYGSGLMLLTETTAKVSRKRNPDRRVFTSSPLLRLWLRDPVEQISFFLVQAHIRRARDVKLRVVALAIQLLVSPTVILLTMSRVAGGSGSMTELVFIAMAGAYVAALPVQLIGLLRTSEAWLAAALFYQAPNVTPAALFHGARKAVILLFCAPAYVFIAILLLCTNHSPKTLLLLLPGMIVLNVVSVLPALRRPFVPLSEPPQPTRSAVGCAFLFVVFAVAISVGFLSAVCWKAHWFGWMLLAELVVVVAVRVVMDRFLAKQRLDAPR